MAELFMESSSNSSSSPQDPGGGKSLITQRPARHERQTDVNVSGEQTRAGSGGTSDSPARSEGVGWVCSNAALALVRPFTTCAAQTARRVVTFPLQPSTKPRPT